MSVQVLQQKWLKMRQDLHDRAGVAGRYEPFRAHDTAANHRPAALTFEQNPKEI